MPSAKASRKGKSRKSGKRSGRSRTRFSRRESAAYREAVLVRAVESILGRVVLGIDYPGGRSRESYRMRLDNDETVIATRRESLDKAHLEIRLLESLNGHAVPVPRLLGHNHAHVLIQEDIGGRRLSRALQDEADNASSCEALLRQAADGLALVQEAAAAERLEDRVEARGAEEQWIRGLIARPSVIGNYLELDTPPLDTEALTEAIRVRDNHFIKWDARPGNALVADDGRVVWFDWEHAGRRNRLDDLAWLLGDEFVPEHPEAETRIIESLLPRFATRQSLEDAHRYLMLYGTFHLVVRLGLILKYKDDTWWDIDHCIEQDKIGVTLDCAERLCRRGARWSATYDQVSALSPWFDEAYEKISEL